MSAKASERAVKPVRLQLQDLLYSQGFGTRRICQGLIEQGHTRLGLLQGASVCDDPWQVVEVERDEIARIIGSKRIHDNQVSLFFLV